MNESSIWRKVATKKVIDMDDTGTDYTWYNYGDTHIFMFGDVNTTEPDEEYADWVVDNYQEALDWFNNYTGFGSFEDYPGFEDTGTVWYDKGELNDAESD